MSVGAKLTRQLDVSALADANRNAMLVDLPIAYDNEGNELVPLKAITAILSINYTSQYDKLKREPHKSFLGVSLAEFNDGRQRRQMVGIRVDRLSSYLLSVSPARCRGMGNDFGAENVETRWRRWCAEAEKLALKAAQLRHPA